LEFDWPAETAAHCLLLSSAHLDSFFFISLILEYNTTWTAFTTWDTGGNFWDGYQKGMFMHGPNMAYMNRVCGYQDDFLSFLSGVALTMSYDVGCDET
jgi:hypothetical protein